MSSNIKLTNENGRTTTISSGSNTTDITLDGSKLMHQVDTIASLRALAETPDTVYVTGYNTAGDGAFGSNFFKLISSVGVDNGGTIIVPTGVTTYHYALQYSGAVNVQWFGANEVRSDNEVPINLALNNSEIVFIPSGEYVVSGQITIPISCKKLVGGNRFDTKITQVSVNTPSTVITTLNGAEYTSIESISVILKASTVGDSTSKAFQFSGTRRSTMKDLYVYVDGHTLSIHSGVGYYWNMDTEASAYTNRLINCTAIATTYGLWSKGPLTSSVITMNQFKSLNGIRFDRDSIIAGTTAIVGNQIYGNLIQSHSTDTWNTGNGIDFGQLDAALTFTYAYSNQLGSNYIERFQNGILLREGSKNNYIDSQSWDNNTSNIVDLNSDKDGYSGIDAQTFSISTKDQTIKFTNKGSQFTDKTNNNTTLNGSSKTLDVSEDGAIITADYRRIRIWGDGAVRTGAVISTASAIEGQRLTLIGFSWSVTLSTTNLLLADIAPVLGNASGQVALIEFEYDSSLASWIECYRHARL